MTVGPPHTVVADNLLLDVRPPKQHAPIRFVKRQNSVLHPRIHRARGLAEAARDLCLADETFRFDFFFHILLLVRVARMALHEKERHIEKSAKIKRSKTPADEVSG